jgi:replicative DNA helicase
VIARADRELIDLQRGRAAELEDVRTTSDRLFAVIESNVARKGQLHGIETGFPSINAQTYGWMPGDLIVIAARPSIGKTVFALNTSVAAARAGAHVAFFSLEMRTEQLEYRLLTALSGVPGDRIKSGYLGEPDFAKLSDAMGVLAGLPIFISDRGRQTVWDVRSACRRVKSEHGLQLVVIDYVQLMAGSLERRGANRQEEITDISRRLKDLADELSVPILLVSQLNRGAETRADPRPKLSDLRESGALEQDADLVCFLHRKHHRVGGTTNFILEKQRNGPTGTVNLTLDRETQQFTDGGEDEPAQVASEAERVKAPKLWRRGRT